MIKPQQEKMHPLVGIDLAGAYTAEVSPCRML